MRVSGEPPAEAGRSDRLSVIGALLRVSYIDMHEQPPPQVLDTLLAKLAADADAPPASPHGGERGG